MTTPIIPALRSRADQDEIIEAFAERLREHPSLNASNVVTSDQPIPVAFPMGSPCICVAPGAGEFPHDLWANGHHATATEDGSIIVGIYLQALADSLGRKEALITSRAPGRKSIMSWKRDVLKLLTVSNEAVPTGFTPKCWEPSIDGRPLLRDIPAPVRATVVFDVTEQKKGGWYGLQLTFSCTWDWDLYRA